MFNGCSMGGENYMRRKGVAVALAVTMGLSGLMTAIPANAEAATED